MMRFDKINPAATQYAANAQLPIVAHSQQGMSKNILIVYTPRVLPTQVVRPYIVDDSPMVKAVFSNEVSNKLVSNKSGISTDLKLQLLPHNMGFRLNNDALASKFTFTLITNNSSPVIAGMNNPSSIKRVYCGYFTDQPFSDQYLNGFDVNPDLAINELAFMIVTDTVVRSAATTSNDKGKHVRNTTAINDSLFNAAIVNFTPNPDMFLMTNDALLTSDVYAMDNPDTGRTYSATVNHMASILGNPSSMTISNKFKNPTEQLKDLVNAAYSHQLYKDDNTVYTDTEAVGSHVHSRAGIAGISYGGLQVNEPIPVKDMVRFVSPEIQVVKMTNTPGYAVKDQDLLSLDVQLSSLVTHTATAILSNEGVYSCVILYQSCQPTPISVINEPAWSVQDIIVDGVGLTDSDLLIIQNRIMATIQSDICDVIKAIAGDFEMVISYTGGGDCMVDLTLMDFESNRGFTTTPNVFGSIVSPLMGTREHIEHNALRVNNLVM